MSAPTSHAHQTEVSKGIPRTAAKKLKNLLSFSPRRDRMVSPDRPGHTWEDSELALDEGEQAKEAEVALELGLVAEMLEVRIVRLDDGDLHAFRIAFGRRSRPRRSRSTRCAAT